MSERRAWGFVILIAAGIRAMSGVNNGIIDGFAFNPPTVSGWARFADHAAPEIRIEAWKEGLVAEGVLDRFRPGFNEVCGFSLPCPGIGAIDLLCGRAYLLACGGDIKLRLPVFEKLALRLMKALTALEENGDKLSPVTRYFLSSRSRLSDAIRKFLVDQQDHPTELCHLMSKHGSDKGGGTWHNYTQLYSRLFAPFRSEEFDVFELGIGSNNEDVPSNM